MSDLIGTTVEGYRIEAELGRGGQAVVYRATQLSLQRTVALKVVSPQLSGDPGFLERFRREGISAASLEHPHVIPVYEAGQAEGMAFLAMKHVEGPGLDQLIRDEGALDVQRALALLRQVAEALDAIHERHLIHRDVKPANILIAPGDHAYLSDFGLSKALASARLTGTGVWMGTLEYVAPEQIKGGEVTSAADRYALGVVAYEALTGRPPFEREDRSAMMYAHLNDVPEAPSALRNKLGTALDAVVLSAMAKDPDDRYTTATAFVDALADAISATPGASTPSSSGAPTVIEEAAGDAGAAEPPTGGAGGEPPAAAAAPAGTGRPRWFLPAVVGGGVAALVALVVIILVVASGGGGSSLELAPEGPDTAQPLGQVLPRQVPRWSLSGVNPEVLNLNLSADLLSSAEGAQATNAADVALLVGITPAAPEIAGELRRDLGTAPTERPYRVDREDRAAVYDVEGGVVVSNVEGDVHYLALAADEEQGLDVIAAVSEAVEAD